MFMSDWSALMTPQKVTLDSKRTLLWFVFYQRLSPQFQFSLSPAALDIYIYGSHLIFIIFSVGVPLVYKNLFGFELEHFWTELPTPLPHSCVAKYTVCEQTLTNVKEQVCEIYQNFWCKNINFLPSWRFLQGTTHIRPNRNSPNTEWLLRFYNFTVQ
jgi:hypothetical protein